MPTETEELRLVVTLTDNASAGIARLRQELQGLGTGSSRENMERFKRDNEGLSRLLKGVKVEAGDAFAAIRTMGVGLGVATAGYTALAGAAAIAVKNIVDTADKVRALNQAARAIGASSSGLESITRQFEEQGLSAQQALQTVEALQSSMAELSRPGNQLERTLLNMAGPSPDQQRAMLQWIERYKNARNEEDALRIAQELRRNVEANAYRENLAHHMNEQRARAEAARRGNEAVAKLGIDAVAARAHIKEMSEEDKKAAESRMKALEQYANLTSKIGGQWQEIKDILSSGLLHPLNEALKIAAALMNEIVTAFKWIRDYSTDAKRDPSIGTGKGTGPGSGLAKPGEDPLTGLPMPGAPGAAPGAVTPDTSTLATPESKALAQPAPPGTAAPAPGVAPGAPAAPGAAPGAAPTSVPSVPGGAPPGVTGAPPPGVTGAPTARGGAAAPSGSIGAASGGQGYGRPTPYGSDTGGSDASVPADIIARAKQVAVQGGPAAVSQFMAQQGYPKNGNWCGEFAASVVKSVGGTPPKGAAVASNWRKWGDPVSDPQPGDVAIRKLDKYGRYVPTGDTGSHVTFVEGVDPKTGKFTGLGGNQGRVESQYNVGAYEYRRPRGTPPNGQTAGPGTGAGAGDTPAGGAAAGNDGPITAGRGGKVSPVALEGRLNTLIKGSGLEGYVPPDAARYGIKTGSSEEWANLMTKMAGKESGFNTNTVGDVGRFGSGSRGMFQLSAQDAVTYGIRGTPFTKEELADPDFNARMAVIIADKRAHAGGIAGPKGMASYWAGRKGYLARGEIAVDRNQIDRTTAQTHKVEGTANLSVDVKAPNGTKVSADTEGPLFKKTEINRQRQMEPARQGPVAEELPI